MTTDPAAALERSRVALGRALMHYALQRLPDGYAYSSGMVNRLVLRLLEKVDNELAEHFAAMELEEDE